MSRAFPGAGSSRYDALHPKPRGAAMKRPKRAKGTKTRRRKPRIERQRLATSRNRSAPRFQANKQRRRELEEAREQLAATSEILKVISRSRGELEPVFKAMLENAVRICGAKFGNLFLCEGNAFRAVAFHRAPPAYVEERQRNPVIRPGPATGLGRVMTTKRPVQIPDIQNNAPDSSDAAGIKFVRLTGARTVL